jgi:aminopeptidase N
MKKNFVYGLVLASILFSCGVSKNASKEDNKVSNETSPTISTEEKDTDEVVKIPVYRASETRSFDLIHTKLDVKFDWTKSYMYGTAWITLKPHFYTQDSLVLDAKSMDIASVECDDKPLKFNYKNDYLTIYLGKSYTKNDQVTVKIKYTAKPNEKASGGSAAIMEDKGLYFINPNGEEKNKMPQIWTQGETEASSVWFPTLDSPNQKMTQEISMTVEDKYVTLSNGLLVKSTKNTDGTRTDYWKTELPFAPYLTMMAVGEFKIVKDSYTKKDGTKIEVNYYVEPEWEKYAKDIFGQTPEMIQYFSQLLGVEYPWAKFSQIVVRDYVSGAMENVGAVVFGDFVYKSKRELIDGNDRSTIAHELFHHWFGDLVTAESWSNLPLNESFANYSQYLWDEYKEGQDEAEYKAMLEAEGYFQTEEYQGSHNMIWYDYATQEQMFDGHSYNKGGRILNMLRNVVGDSAFFTSLHVYLTENKFGTGEIDQLRLAFEKVTGEDLNWFFNQWFLAKGHPILKVSKVVANGQVAVTIEQNQNLKNTPLYRLPMKITVFDKDVRNDYSVVLNQSMQTFIFPIKDSLSAVIVDADHVILAKWNTEASPEEGVYQFYHGGKYMDRKDGFENGVRSKTLGKQLVLDALNDKFYDIRLMAIKQANRIKRTNKEQLVAKLKEMVNSDPISKVRSSALTFLLNNFSDETGMKELAIHVLESDSSYLVESEALFGLAKFDSTMAMNKAKELENENSQEMLSKIAVLYGRFGSEANYPFFEKTLTENTIGGLNKIGVLSGLTNLVKRSNIAIQTKAYDLYENESKNGGIYARIVLPGFIDSITSSIDTYIKSLDASKTTEIDAAKQLKEKYENLMINSSNAGEE